MKAIPWLLLAIAIIVIILLSKCEGNKQPTVIVDSHASDSVAAVNAITIAAKDDTIMKLKLQLGTNSIELNRSLASKEDIERKAGNQIAELTIANNMYATALSTRDSINACNEYRKAAERLYKSGEAYVGTINKLVKDGRERLRLDSLSGVVKDKAIASIQLQYQTTAGYLTTARGMIGDLQQKEKKRFVVGPFVGVALSSQGKVVPVGGLGITYRLFRF